MIEALRKACLALVVASLTALPVSADEPKQDPHKLVEEGMQKIVRALELLIRSIPEYEKPEINEHGDIIIRRKRRRGEPPRLPDPKSKKPPAPRKAI
jgi:hypothetical protein